MKKKLLILIAVLVLLTVIVLYKKYSDEMNKYVEYVDFRLNICLNSVCDNILRMECIIQKVTDTGYMLESELEALHSSYNVYFKNIIMILDIAEILRDYNFQESNLINRDYKFVFEYTDFFHRIDDLFGNRDYKRIPSQKYYLNDNELKVFEQSYEFISKAAQIVKKNFDFYNIYKTKIIEKETGKGTIITFDYELREGYEEPREVQHIHIHSSDDKWFELLKEFQKLNRVY